MTRTFAAAMTVAALLTAPMAVDAQSNHDARSNHDAESSHENGTDKNIVTIAVEAGMFTTLAAALEAADLIDVLQGDGPFTVFAPTDEAFAKLPAGTVEALLADKEALTRILTYHVVAGQVTSDAVVNLSEASTVAGIDAPIEVKMGNVYVAGAKVTTADVMASNGVIHIIDAVMLPPKM